MRFCKPGHYSRQRKKKAEKQKDQEAVIWSGENINRKAEKEKKKSHFPDVWEGFSGRVYSEPATGYLKVAKLSKCTVRESSSRSGPLYTQT